MVAWLMACVFGLSAIPFLAATRAGVQCPTAAVQRKTEVDRQTGVSTVRVPQPGDKDFVQCRCAEKKAAVKQTVVASSRFDPVIPLPVIVELPERPTVAFALEELAPRLAERSSPPLPYPPPASG